MAQQNCAWLAKQCFKIEDLNWLVVMSTHHFPIVSSNFQWWANYLCYLHYVSFLQKYIHPVVRSISIIILIIMILTFVQLSSMHQWTRFYSAVIYATVDQVLLTNHNFRLNFTFTSAVSCFGITLMSQTFYLWGSFLIIFDAGTCLMYF